MADMQETPNNSPQPQWQNDQEQIAEPSYGVIQWTSAEFTEQDKDTNWYLMFGSITALITVTIFIVTRELLAIAAILTASGSLIFFANHKPDARDYGISPEGITVNGKQHKMEEFKSFSLVEEGTKNTIWLKPIKRFAPFPIMYFDTKDEAAIVDTLSAYLPHEDRQLDLLDRLTKKLRF